MCTDITVPLQDRHDIPHGAKPYLIDAAELGGGGEGSAVREASRSDLCYNAVIQVTKRAVLFPQISQTSLFIQHIIFFNSYMEIYADNVLK